jgi:hypothetical protein
MANTLVLLEKVTVGAAGAASITFSNIPQTGYTDLCLVASLRGNNGGVYETPQIRFNGLTTNLSTRRIISDGSSTPASTYYPSNIYVVAPSSGATASTFGNLNFYIPNYTGSTNKSLSTDSVTENNATEAETNLGAGLWASTAAINQITLVPQGSLFVQYSTATLYGVSNVNTTPLVAPKATGGDIIQTDGTYWYHAFLNSGTFTPATALRGDVLVIAGGGAGGTGSGIAGGGGAGGLQYFASQSLSTTSYTCTIGSGGTASGTAARGGNGVDSTFQTLSAATGGGGGGGGFAATPSSLTGGNGGSGGGGGEQSGTYGAGGTAASGQGNAGSTARASTLGVGAGGGAGTAGVVKTSGQSDFGGVGLSTYSSWGSATATGENVSGTYYYAGGGGGGGYTGYCAAGSGGSGGGGAGGFGAVGTAGSTNTGGGGGGAGAAVGGQGGSGIIIVRYTVA